MIALGILLMQAGSGVAGIIRPSGARLEVVVELIAVDRPGSGPVGDTAFIDQREIAFVPRTLTATVGTTILFRNSDPILHNVFSPRGPDGGFDLGTYPQPDSKAHRFTEVGEWIVLCHVHPEMVAYIEVVGSRWHAATDRDGRFSIPTVPPGRYRLAAWASRSPPIYREIEVVAGRVTEVELELPPNRRRGG